MQAIVDYVFWCSRCGTIRHRHVNGEDQYFPRLVNRTRDYHRQVGASVRADLDRLGITESITSTTP